MAKHWRPGKSRYKKNKARSYQVREYAQDRRRRRGEWGDDEWPDTDGGYPT